MATFYGADISRWQGQVNWPAFNPGASFVMFKAGGGDDGNYIDSQYINNLNGARSLGTDMPHGLYWFAGGSDDPTGEANWFVDNILGGSGAPALQPGEVVVLDAERGNTVDPAWAKPWLDTVAARIGWKPLIYMNQSTMLSHDWSAVVAADYGLWLADWDGDPNAIVQMRYWSFCAFQQYEDNGTFPGIAGPVDADAFFAPAITDFYKYGKPSTPPPAPVVTPAPTQPPATPAPTPPAPSTPPLPNLVNNVPSPPSTGSSGTTTPNQPPQSSQPNAPQSTAAVPTPSADQNKNSGAAGNQSLSFWQRLINFIRELFR